MSVRVFFYHICTAGNEETKGESDERLQTGLLAGIIMVMVVVAAAVSMSVYMYSHPTSSASLFFMEVSDNQLLYMFILLRT